jgi:AcrR family transcriptional regulator
VGETSTPRRREIVAAARRIVEQEGSDALTMRRLGAALGIRAPSLYKHFPDKAAVEVALLDAGFREVAAALETALERAEAPLAGIVSAYRAYALAHPHLYRLMTGQPLPRERLEPGVEQRAAAPLLRAAGGDVALARAMGGRHRRLHRPPAPRVDARSARPAPQ